MNHPSYQDIADSVNLSLSELDTDTLRSQMRGPIVLSTILPMGLLGAFAALMLAAFVSTHDTYLHSWATIIIQDVVMPFRDKPFDKDTHIKVLRYAIFGVAVFSYSFLVYYSSRIRRSHYSSQLLRLFLQVVRGQLSLVDSIGNEGLLLPHGPL